MISRRTRLCVALVVAIATLTYTPLAVAQICDTDYLAEKTEIRLQLLSSVSHPVEGLQDVCKKFSVSSVDFDPGTAQMFVTNPFDAALEIHFIGDLLHPVLVKSIFLGGYSGNTDPLHFSRPEHVAVAPGVVAVAISNDPVDKPGLVALFDTKVNKRHEIPVGSKPVTLAFTPDARKIIVVNQGIPNDDYSIDPEASISIIDLAGDGQPTVRTVTFEAFNDQKEKLIQQGVRLYGPCRSSEWQRCDAGGTATVAQDLEPVSLAIGGKSAEAWISFEANNAIARLDIPDAKITDIWSPGVKNHNLAGNQLDANSDNLYDLANWPVFGLLQPDGLALFESQGQSYLITANRGNWREYGGFTERMTVAEACSTKRLETRLCYETAVNGVNGIANSIPDLKIARYPFRYSADATGALAAPYSFGGRSFAIWSPLGSLVYDSGSELERITHQACPAFFNAQSDRNTFDDRSDDKGPEPEAVTVGEISGRQYAFVTLRRIGGIMVYDISDPARPVFQQYINNRDFSVDPKAIPESPLLIPPLANTKHFVNCRARDLQPIDAHFVAKRESPSGEPLLLVSNNFSGTTSIFRIIATRSEGK